MRSRSPHDDHVADVTRRRLEALVADLELGGPPDPVGPGEPAVESDPDSAEVQSGRHAQRPGGPSRGPAARTAAWCSDRLPPVLRSQPGLGSAQVGLVALVVAVGVVLGAWWLVRGRGEELAAGEAVPPRVTSVASGELPAGPGADPAGNPPAPLMSAPPGPVSSPAPGTSPATGAAAAGPGGQIVVDVVGQVRRPGIAVLPVGSRVADAVEAAGGLRRSFAGTGVNMARVLVDGEQVVVARGQGAASSAGGGASYPPQAPPAAAPLVSLNTADQAALETLPGVGPVTAAAILQWRAEHGGFTAVEELLEVSGIGDATLAQIAPHVTL